MRRTCRIIGIAAMLGSTVLPPTTTAAPAAAPSTAGSPTVASSTAAPPRITNTTVYATRGSREWSQIFRLTLDSTGKVVAQHDDIAPDGDTYDRATDVTRAGMIHARQAHRGVPARIVVRRPGTDPVVIPGLDGVFTPGRTAVLFRWRYQNPDPGGDDHDQLRIQYLSSTRAPRPLLAAEVDTIQDYRYSLDGKKIWMLAHPAVNGEDGLMEYRIPQGGQLGHTIPISGCSDFEFVASWRRVVLACGTELRVVDLATREVTGHFPLPAGRFADRITGRLAPGILLVSAHSRNAQGQELSWLGALDIGTMAVRPLPRSTGFHSAAAAY
jgi:hypothetical protein